MLWQNLLAVFQIDHLILVPDRFAAFFEDEIFDSVVRTVRKFPFPGKFEVGEFFCRDDVARFAAGLELKFAFFNDPPFFRHGLLSEAAPPGGGLSIEEEFPAVFLFFWSEFVVRAEGGSDRKEQSGCESQHSFVG